MIRKALIDDVKNLHHLESSIFSKDEFGISLSSFYYHVKRNPIFVYEEDSKIGAYILWLKRKNYYRLYSICVDKSFQGKGISKKLLLFSFEQLDNSSYQLEVKVNNSIAISLYEKYGFRIKKTIKDYYPNNIDAFLMIREKDVNTL
ncbi:GNAT family N-acetyltransferase [Arcobacter sp. YIC-464]|uniref:GNAT family N-acetyltransferase n=1 Tax=Arcobacter sp. YIC-464 TaxID=3376631 RepID=UPI003C15B05F